MLKCNRRGPQRTALAQQEQEQEQETLLLYARLHTFNAWKHLKQRDSLTRQYLEYRRNYSNTRVRSDDTIALIVYCSVVVVACVLRL